MLKVTADSNVLVSALLFKNGKPHQFLQKALSGEINLTVSKVELYVIKEDPADNRIPECAVSPGSDYIVSGDNDLLRLGRYDAIRMVSLADFLQIADKHDYVR